jgi:hypothetical protein
MSDSRERKIRWAPPVPPVLLRRLYESDAAGLPDEDLCDDVGMRLFLRCRTFGLVGRREVECPVCGSVFPVSQDGARRCPNPKCEWQTTPEAYAESLRNYNAHTGRAIAAYQRFEHRYPRARSYREKMLLIDELVHSFHVDEKTQRPVKSIASKLLEGNKKQVVRFLDELSAMEPERKHEWRETMAKTIDRRIVERDEADE